MKNSEAVDIYQYSLGINGIREEVYEDVYTNSDRDKFIIDEMSDCGGHVLYELFSVDDDRLTSHVGYGDCSNFLNYTEPKSDEYVRNAMYEGFRLQALDKTYTLKHEIEVIEHYQNLLREM